MLSRLREFSASKEQKNRKIFPVPKGGIRKSLGLNCAVFAYLITAFGEQVQDLTYFFLAQSS
jgi:hypothetical protein